MDSIPPGSRVVAVAATNRLDLIDTALLQANRFGIHISTSLPDGEARKSILMRHLKDIPLTGGASAEEIAENIATDTSGFSGAELEALCQRAKLLALWSCHFTREVPLTMEYFNDALTGMVQSRKERSIYGRTAL
jgi:cell division protease FtsH